MRHAYGVVRVTTRRVNCTEMLVARPDRKGREQTDTPSRLLGAGGETACRRSVCPDDRTSVSSPSGSRFGHPFGQDVPNPASRTRTDARPVACGTTRRAGVMSGALGCGGDAPQVGPAVLPTLCGDETFASTGRRCARNCADRAQMYGPLRACAPGQRCTACICARSAFSAPELLRLMGDGSTSVETGHSISL